MNFWQTVYSLVVDGRSLAWDGKNILCAPPGTNKNYLYIYNSFLRKKSNNNWKRKLKTNKAYKITIKGVINPMHFLKRKKIKLDNKIVL